MNHFQVIRIVFLLLLIFSAGVLTGRFTAPKPHFVTVAPGGRVQTAEAVLTMFKRQIPLTAQQEEKFRKLFQELEGEISLYPPLSDERLEIFRRTLPRMKELLSPEQRPALDRYARDIERRFEINRRRRGL
jgi:hypothetical protein